MASAFESNSGREQTRIWEDTCEPQLERTRLPVSDVTQIPVQLLLFLHLRLQPPEDEDEVSVQLTGSF